MGKPYLSIVIPSYNEKENFLQGTLERVADYLEKQTFSWEVILVDDGSIDGTLTLLSKFIQSHPRFKLMPIKHGGKFKAVAKGIEVAKGEIILFTDFDQSTPIREFEKMKKAFNKGADLVIGDRVKGKRVGDPLFRYVRSRIFNFLVQCLLLPGISDTQCGFKAFKATCGKDLFSSLLVSKEPHVKGGYMGAFDVELLYLAKKKGYKIVSVPVEWVYAKSGRLSFVEPFWMFLDILKIRIFDILGKYKK